MADECKQLVDMQIDSSESVENMVIRMNEYSWIDSKADWMWN